MTINKSTNKLYEIAQVLGKDYIDTTHHCRECDWEIEAQYSYWEEYWSICTWCKKIFSSFSIRDEDLQDDPGVYDKQAPSYYWIGIWDMILYLKENEWPRLAKWKPQTNPDGSPRSSYIMSWSSIRAPYLSMLVRVWEIPNKNLRHQDQRCINFIHKTLCDS